MVGLLEDGKDHIFDVLGYSPTIINARFIKPMDEILLRELCNDHNKIITIEEGALIGGFGSSVSDFMNKERIDNELFTLGIPDEFIGHGERNSLLSDIGISIENIINLLNQ